MSMLKNNSKFAVKNPLQALELIDNLNAETSSIFNVNFFVFALKKNIQANKDQNNHNK